MPSDDSSRTPPTPVKRVFGWTVNVLWLTLVLAPGVVGWDYYSKPLEERAFHEMHEQLKPTGFVGHGYGIVGSLFMLIGVGTYSLRKRVSWMQNLGKLRSWLRFHIFLCTTGPALVLWHTSLKFQGIVAVSFWSMVLVVASGVLGRYVYNRIPKTEDGKFRNVEFLRDEQRETRRRIGALIELSPDHERQLGLSAGALNLRSTWSALLEAIRFDVNGLVHARGDRAFFASRRLDSGVQEQLVPLLRDYRWKTRQQVLLEPLQRIFTYWHVFHLPLASLMFLILAVHVGVAIVFGYTWIFG